MPVPGVAGAATDTRASTEPDAPARSGDPADTGAPASTRKWPRVGLRPTFRPTRGVTLEAVTSGGDAAPADNPAGSALHRILSVFSAAVHGSSGLACAAAALAVRTAPVDVPLLVAVVTALTAWSAVFVVQSLRRGIRPWLIWVDVLLTAATCLLIGRLVAAEVLPGEGSWVAITASTTVLITQLNLAARWSLPAGLLVVASYALGAHLAGDDTEATAHAVTLTVQVFSGAGLAWLARRSSRSADIAFAGYQDALRQAVVDRATRAAERRQNRDLHDTVLSTLTVVGLGAVRSGPALRERAAADLRTLADRADARADAEHAEDAGPTTRVERLDERLRDGLAGRPGLRVSLAPAVVPPVVSTALVGAVGEALSNAARHAPGAAVEVSLVQTADGVVVEVVDAGPGFDPARVPTHRYGLRESVYGRLATVGGVARVESAPGRGTRIRLAWPRPEETP